MNHVNDIPVFHQLYMSRVTTKLSFVGVSMLESKVMPEFVILSCNPTRVLGDLGRRVIYFSGIWRANKLFWGYREQ